MSSNWVRADTNLTQKISPDSDDLVCNMSYAAYDMQQLNVIRSYYIVGHCLKHINIMPLKFCHFVCGKTRYYYMFIKYGPYCMVHIVWHKQLNYKKGASSQTKRTSILYIPHG